VENQVNLIAGNNLMEATEIIDICFDKAGFAVQFIEEKIRFMIVIKVQSSDTRLLINKFFGQMEPMKHWRQ